MLDTPAPHVTPAELALDDHVIDSSARCVVSWWRHSTLSSTVHYSAAPTQSLTYSTVQSASQLRRQLSYDSWK